MCSSSKNNDTPGYDKEQEDYFNKLVYDNVQGLALSILGSAMCQEQCSRDFTVKPLWTVASGFSLLLIPLFMPFSSGEGAESVDNPSKPLANVPEV
jgi:hypothetical protein